MSAELATGSVLGSQPAWTPMETSVKSGAVIGDPRIEAVYRYWCKCQRDGSLPRDTDIHPDEISAAIASHTMVLDVVRTEAAVRFRYRRVGKVFWRAGGVEPTGHFLDEVLPTKAGYRDYVIGIYREVTESKRPLYTENLFTRHGHSVPIGAKRVSLPITKDGGEVDMILAAHVFEYQIFLEHPHHRDPLATVDGLREAVRAYLAEKTRP